MSLRSRERALLRAFAEALLPAGGDLPGAEGENGVAVVDPVCELLEAAPGRVRLGVRAALYAFELTTFPRRFSRLGLEYRAAHLARVDRGRGIRRELFLLLKTLTTFGYARDPGVAARIEPKPAVRWPTMRRRASARLRSIRRRWWHRMGSSAATW